MANLTSKEIRDKIKAKESFWVGSENERKVASACAMNLGLKYRTGKDERGGFYVSLLPLVKIPKSSKLKVIAAILFLAGSLHASDLWSALSQIESGDCDTCIGTSGEIGRWQQKPKYWRLYTKLPLSAAVNPFTALNVAKADMADRVKNFVAHNGRQPAIGEQALLWRCPPKDVLHPNAGELAYEQRFLNLVNSK